MSGETKPFPKRLSEGHEFEDFCVDVLWDNGIAVLLYRSRQRQWTSGESRLGAEIKLDRQWCNTGNLFIECEERRNSDGTSLWRKAGIYEETQPWLYVIGNERLIWIHGVRILQILHDTKGYKWRETDTAKGFLLPLPDSDKYALKKITPTASDEPQTKCNGATTAIVGEIPGVGNPAGMTAEEIRDQLRQCQEDRLLINRPVSMREANNQNDLPFPF